MKRNHGKLPAILTAAVFLVSLPSFAGDGFSAKIRKVQDGDSLIVGQKGRHLDVDLAGVRAPSLRQDFGTEARELLHDLADGRQAEIEVIRERLDGTLVARVVVDGRDLATAVLAAGFGSPTTEATPQAIAAAEKAKDSQTGMWAAIAGDSSEESDS